MKNKITYTQNDSVIVNTLKSAGKPLTLNELNKLANKALIALILKNISN